MTKNNTVLPYINSQLRYDSQIGVLWWKQGLKGRRFTRPAGGLDSKGHIRIRLKIDPNMTLNDAVIARKEAEIRIFKEFAPLCYEQ